MAGVEFLSIEDPDAPGTGVLTCLIPKSDAAPHMATGPDLHSYFRRVGCSFRPIEHYEVADLFGRRPRPVLGLEFEKRLKPNMEKYGMRGRNELDVRVLLKNLGGAVARFPCVSVKKIEGWPLSDRTKNVIKEGHAGLPTVRAPLGWQHRLAGGADSVLFPGDVLQVVILAFYCSPGNEVFPDLEVTVEAIAAGAPPVSETFTWPWAQIVSELELAWYARGSGGNLTWTKLDPG